MVINLLKNRVLTCFYLILLLTSTTVHAFVQEVDQDNPFGLLFEDETALQVENHKAQLEFIFTIPKNHYLYREQFRIRMKDSTVKVNLQMDDGTVVYDSFFEKETAVFYDEVIVTAIFDLPKDFDQSVIEGSISYQGCSDRICYRPMRQSFELALKNSAGTSQVNKEILNNDVSFFEKAFAGKVDLKTEGPLLAIIICIIFGFLSSLSVCVLPLIPLTLSFMGVTKGSRKNFLRLLIFLLGLVSMNAPLGMAAAWLGLSFGFQFQNPYFLMAIILLFMIVGFWMLGVFQFQVPVKWQSRITKYQPKGLMRAYFSGLTIGLLAFSCVGPFIIPILGFVSSSQNVAYGGMLMVSYSLGMSILFVLAAFFSTTWMKKFGQKSHVLKRVTGVFMLVFACYFGWVWLDAYILKPYAENPKGQIYEVKFFRKDYKAALEEAKSQNKGILLDFYADWCLPCKQWDAQVWSKPSVQKAVLEKFIPVKIDCTTDGPECSDVANPLDIVGMPSVVFLNSSFNEIAGSRMPNTKTGLTVPTANEFVENLKQID